jgi:hypothetical protein
MDVSGEITKTIDVIKTLQNVSSEIVRADRTMRSFEDVPHQTAIFLFVGRIRAKIFLQLGPTSTKYSYIWDP